MDIIADLKAKLQEACRAADIYKDECVRERRKYNESEQKRKYLRRRLEVQEEQNREMQHKFYNRLKEAFQTTGKL